MADMVAVVFDGPDEADRVLARLQQLEKEYLVDLADAVVAIRDAKGKIRLKQSVDMVGAGMASGGLSGMLWGTLVGLLFLNPIAGFAIGSVVGLGTGALAGALADYGIDDDFIKSLAQSLTPDKSALFVLVRKVQPEKVLAEFTDVRGEVLRSSLAPDKEARLRELLSGIQAEAAGQSATDVAGETHPSQL